MQIHSHGRSTLTKSDCKMLPGASLGKLVGNKPDARKVINLIILISQLILYPFTSQPLKTGLCFPCDLISRVKSLLILTSNPRSVFYLNLLCHLHQLSHGNNLRWCVNYLFCALAVIRMGLHYSPFWLFLLTNAAKFSHCLSDKLGLCKKKKEKKTWLEAFESELQRNSFPTWTIAKKQTKQEQKYIYIYI